MYSRAILSDCYWVPSEEVKETTVKEFEYKPKFDPKKEIIAYRIKNGMFGFPRNIRPEAIIVRDQTRLGRMITVRFTGKLRPGQIPLKSDLRSNLEKDVKDQILEADTGSGKSVVLIDYLAWLSCAALIVVTKSDLLDHWRDHLLRFTDLTEDDIGIARQKICDFEGKKVVVGMIHSLCKDKYPEEFKKHFGLVIFDELHKLGAPHFSKVGGMFPAAYRVGATATLDRTDGMEALFYAHLGKKVVHEKKSVQPIPKVIIAPYVGLSGIIPSWVSGDMQTRGVLINLLVDNGVRTRKLSTAIKTMVESGRQTLVFMRGLFSILLLLVRRWDIISGLPRRKKESE
jgi:hypothetical protein